MTTVAPRANFAVRRINRVDIPSLLRLTDADDQPLKVYFHPEVPMRKHILSLLDPECHAQTPIASTHILLDLLPPHALSSMRPTAEQMGFIEHCEHRQVLCGYWAQECLRVEGVAEIGFWDLSGWERVKREEEEQETLMSSGRRSSRAEEVVGDGREGGEEDEEDQEQEEVSPRRSARHAARRTGRGVTIAVPGPSTTADPHLPPTPTSSHPSSSNSAPASSSSSLSASARKRPRPSTTSRPGPSKRRRSAAVTVSRSRAPSLSSTPAEEIAEMWRYFLASACDQLGVPVPRDAEMGTVDRVARPMEKRVHRMWVEARGKYNRRNLDRMSVMLSTWTTARDYDLSPKALKAYYEAHKPQIIAEKAPYVSAHARHPDWPFDKKAPQDPEAKAKWIFDWGSKEAESFWRGEGSEAEDGDGDGEGEGDEERDELEEEEDDTGTGVKAEGQGARMAVDEEDDLEGYDSD